MNWKESKFVGIVAALLVAASVVAIVLFFRSEASGGPRAYFLCESTGELFSVRMDPMSDDFVDNYAEVQEGRSALCKVCGQMDAYSVRSAGGDKWIKLGFAYLQCDSTGGIFDVPATRGGRGYDPEFLQNPGEPVKCRICDLADAVMVRSDGDGGWIRFTPGETFDDEEEGVPPGGMTMEGTGWHQDAGDATSGEEDAAVTDRPVRRGESPRPRTPVPDEQIEEPGDGDEDLQ